METISWMKTQVGTGGESYHDFWLLTEHGLNAGTKFQSRPVINHPEHMPWDLPLNKDVDN